MNKKIYFAGSIRGGRDDAALYKRMIDYMKRTNVVLTEHIGKSNMSLKAQMKVIDTHIYEHLNISCAVILDLCLRYRLTIYKCPLPLHTEQS